MIDWVDCFVPLAHDPGRGSPFYAGEVISTTPDGELDWGIFKRLELVGSHSSKVQVRSTVHDHLPGIRISGNLVKWFQGHNVFGSDDLRGIVLASVDRICTLAGITPSAAEVAAWKAGDLVELFRVDVTESQDLGSRQRVQAALRGLDASANLKMRGRGTYYGDSLVFGKGSRRWSLTAYAKGPEIDNHPLPSSLASYPLKAHAEGLLRLEVRMLSMHLKREGLSTLRAWSENTATEVHQKHLALLEISEATMIDTTHLDALPGRLKAAYQLWKEGHDLREMYPRPTFYRYRSELLKQGIDIAVKQERREEASNVIPLRVVLVAKPATIPDWAMGTPLYFEPAAVAA
jgi:II/X family phage/plasmid replication protein